MNTSSTATLERPTLFEQIGGAGAINAAVEAFYARVLNDPLLQPFFVTVDMTIQKKKQVEFLSQALGGPTAYKGPSMKQAHAHLSIEIPKKIIEKLLNQNLHNFQLKKLMFLVLGIMGRS